MRRPAQIILHRPLISNIFISTDKIRNYVDYVHLILRNFGVCYVQKIERIKQITLN